jgi:hypothetical protein
MIPVAMWLVCHVVRLADIDRTTISSAVRSVVTEWLHSDLAAGVDHGIGIRASLLAGGSEGEGIHAASDTILRRQFPREALFSAATTSFCFPGCRDTQWVLLANMHLHQFLGLLALLLALTFADDSLRMQLLPSCPTFLFVGLRRRCCFEGLRRRGRHLLRCGGFRFTRHLFVLHFHHLATLDCALWNSGTREDGAGHSVDFLI